MSEEKNPPYRIDHETFKKNYDSARYHGDPIINHRSGEPTGETVVVTYYYQDRRTILPDGRAMVVWVKCFGGACTSPGFLKGYTRQDALELAEEKRDGKE